MRTPTGVVLVDAGMDSEGRDVEIALNRAFGATPQDVRAILLTHWHNDHAAGACATHLRSSARVYYHEGDRAQLTRANAPRGVKGWIAARVPELGPLVLVKGLLGEAVPRAVAAHQLIQDGEWIEDEFLVIESPGHTPGHVSFYYKPERILFAGDALAVIGGKIRFMSRPVTPDLVAARRSMVRCLDRRIDHICPGHRVPLSSGVPERAAEMLKRLRASSSWPLFG